MYWSILKAFLNNKRYLVFHLYCTKTNFPRTLRKRLHSLMISVLNNVLLLIAPVNFRQFFLKSVLLNFWQVLSHTIKVHTHDMISVRMLKINEPNCKPIEIIFRPCLEKRKFPSKWQETSNIVSVFKKRVILFCA